MFNEESILPEPKEYESKHTSYHEDSFSCKPNADELRVKIDFDNIEENVIFDIKDFDVSIIADKIVETINTNIRNDDILEGIAFYSLPSIMKEWKNLRSPWYQNNIHYKPNFRKTSIYILTV